MRTTKPLCIAALAAPALLAFAPKADTVAFAPKAGTTVSKTFSTTMNFALDDMTVLMNGEDNGMMPDIEMDMVMTGTTAITDVYGAVSDGRPSKLSRTFDEIGQDIEVEVSVEMMGQTQDETATGTGTSELKGKTVVFEWDADNDEYNLSFAEDEGDDELLENLVEDMSLRGLLPEEDVSEGDSWDIPLRNLVDILAPGGDLKLDVEMDGMDGSMGPDPSMMANMREMFGDMLEGEASGTYKGTREVDGSQVGVIELSIEIDTARDMTDLLEELMGEQIPEGMDMSLDRVDIEFAFEATGELLWDLGNGHVHGLDLKGEAAIAMDMEMAMDAGGQSMTIEMSMEMSGTIEYGVETD